MRRPLMLVQIMVLLAIASGVAAQSPTYVITNSVRLPAESYVGDTVELRYTLRTEATLVEPDGVPQPTWGRVEGLRVFSRPGEYDVRFLATPFEPGTLTFPGIPIGEIELQGLSLVVKSVLEENDTTPRSVVGPQRLPGTQLALLSIALSVSLFLTITIFALGPGRRRVIRLLEVYRSRIPYRRLLKSLQQIEARIAADTGREFYIALVTALQNFMGDRLKRECRAATSSELSSMLSDLSVVHHAPPETASALAQVFQSADEAKFAGATVRRKLRLEHLSVVRDVAAALEESRRSLRRRKKQRRRTQSSPKEAASVGV